MHEWYMAQVFYDVKKESLQLLQDSSYYITGRSVAIYDWKFRTIWTLIDVYYLTYNLLRIYWSYPSTQLHLGVLVHQDKSTNISFVDSGTKQSSRMHKWEKAWNHAIEIFILLLAENVKIKTKIWNTTGQLAIVYINFCFFLKY